jgi:(p)ppGpp synthase/HD superfamily hydrolase
VSGLVADPNESLSFTDDLPLTQAAVRFAEGHHAGQRRGGDRAPFVVHPFEVAALLERSDYPDHVVAAGVLHDVLEDSEATQEELAERFGPDVAGLVATVSDDPDIEDEDEQKADVRARVREAGGYAPPVYAADKVSKVRELRMRLVAGASDDEAQTKRRRYRSSLEMLDEAIPDSRLVDLLRFELEALEKLPPYRPTG